MLVSSYKNSHIISALTAGALHVALGFWAMMPSNPIVINQQAIQVSFVAPNGAQKRIENDSHKENIIKLDEKIALKQQKDQKDEIKNNTKNLAQGKETSGKIDPNAMATRSAESDPIFDADYLNNPAPAYPAEARRRGFEGKVMVQVLVKVDGTAQSVVISRSSGHSQLDIAAVDAVKNWRFVPAKSGNKPVQASVIVPVEFKII